MSHDELGGVFNWSISWDSGDRAKLVRTRPPMFVCPSSTADPICTGAQGNGGFAKAEQEGVRALMHYARAPMDQKLCRLLTIATLDPCPCAATPGSSTVGERGSAVGRAGQAPLLWGTDNPANRRDFGRLASEGQLHVVLCPSLVAARDGASELRAESEEQGAGSRRKNLRPLCAITHTSSHCFTETRANALARR